MAVVVPSGKVTLNAESDDEINSLSLRVSWSNIDNPLTPKFSPDLLDNASLSDKPCFRIYFGLVSAVVVTAVKVSTSGTLATIKSPKLASLAFNTLNLLPTTKPWATVVLKVVTVDENDALPTETQDPKSIICCPSNIKSLAVLETVICFVVLTAEILW